MGTDKYVWDRGIRVRYDSQCLFCYGFVDEHLDGSRTCKVGYKPLRDDPHTLQSRLDFRERNGGKELQKERPHHSVYLDFCKHCDRHASQHANDWCLGQATRFLGG